MKLNELVPWLQGGNGVKGIPQTDVDKCPRGLLINITDMTDAQALKFALSNMPMFADCTVVKIGIPVPEPIKPKSVPKPKKSIAEATSKKSKKSKKDGK
jgi:hypothetical protein